MEKIQCLKENIINPDQTYQYDVDTLKGIPIVIDNGKVNYINYEFHIWFIISGAYQCRVGFANDDQPKLIFRNLIAKLRGKKVFLFYDNQFMNWK